MRSRERLLAALNHREADRIPIDLGGTPTSTISLKALENLKNYLGINEETHLLSSIFLTAFPGNEVLRRFGADVRLIVMNPPSKFELRATMDGKVVDEWGVCYQKHEEAQTHFVVEQEAPLHRVTSKEEIGKYPWPDPADPSRYKGLRGMAMQYRREGWGIIVNTPFQVMTQTAWMRGLEQFIVDTALNSSLIEYIMDTILEIQMEMSRLLLQEVGEYADVVTMGDDLAHQGGLTYSPDMYRKLFKSRHRAIVDFLKKNAGQAKILYHCCGSIEPLLKDLIELGVDALNPVQVSAKGMEDTKRLKSLYGQDLTFWGAIDTQRVLPFGSPMEVKMEVRRRIEDLSEGGGFVLAAVHNIRPEVKPENVCALFEAALEYGRYSQ